MSKIKSQESKVPFKTLMEFCPSEQNLELAVRAIARNKGVITADDLHVLDFSVNKLGRNRQVYGAVLAGLVKQGFLEKVGYVSSSRDVCHHRPILQFRCLEVKGRD
jgi:hypothetical protein